MKLLGNGALLETFIIERRLMKISLLKNIELSVIVLIWLTALIFSVSGCGNGDDGANTNTAGYSENESVIYFRDPIRIGDDKDYNATHDPDFLISTPSGLSYAERFTITATELNSSKAVIRYTIAGAMMGAEIYLNNVLVGTTCNPGNTAHAIKECDAIDITGMLQTGTNELKIVTVLYPYDDVTPYDDIEIYNLRIVLSY